MKFAAIADWADSTDFPVEFMCRELGVSRSGYHAWRGRAPSQREHTDAGLLAVIRQVHERQRGNPGVRRIHAELITLGHWVAPKRVWRLMKAAGLHGRHPKPWKRTTIAGQAPVDRDLLQHATATLHARILDAARIRARIQRN